MLKLYFCYSSAFIWFPSIPKHNSFLKCIAPFLFFIFVTTHSALSCFHLSYLCFSIFTGPSHFSVHVIGFFHCSTLSTCLFVLPFFYLSPHLSLSSHVSALLFLLRSSAVCCWRFSPKTSPSSSRPRCSWCGPSWWERCTGTWRGLTRTWAGCRCPARRCEALGGERRAKEVHLRRVPWRRFHRRGGAWRVKPVQLCIYLGRRCGEKPFIAVAFTLNIRPSF